MDDNSIPVSIGNENEIPDAIGNENEIPDAIEDENGFEELIVTKNGIPEVILEVPKDMVTTKNQVAKLSLQCAFSSFWLVAAL